MIAPEEITRRPKRSQKLTASIVRLSNHVRENTSVMLDKLGWTWLELSKRAGVGTSFIYAIKNGKHSIGTSTVARISDAFKLPPEWIFLPPKDFMENYRKFVDKKRIDVAKSIGATLAPAIKRFDEVPLGKKVAVKEG